MRGKVLGRKSHADADDFAGFSAASCYVDAEAELTAVRRSVLGVLTALFGAKPAEAFILIWLLRDKQSHWFSDLGEAAAFVERYAAEDVYVGVALSPSDFGSQKRCKAERTVGIAALWLDLDFGGDGHRKPNLPPTMEDALSVIPPDL